MTPSITVIIPVYNCEKYVERAIRSVLNQPCSDRVEIIVVNDGSKDRSGEICDRIAVEHNNVRVLHKENGGVSSARNMGIERAEGEYVAFLDSDDWWEPDFLDEPTVEKLPRGGADVYEFAFRQINYYKTMEKIYPVTDEKLVYDHPETERYDWHHFCSYMYKREFLDALCIRFPQSIKVGEDTAFIEMVLYSAKTQERINKMIFSYWECLDSCLHTAGIKDKLIGRKKSYGVKWDYFTSRGCQHRQDEREMALSTVENLPRLCAELSYGKTLKFVDENCNCYLRENPKEKLWASFQKRVDVFNEHPFRFWLKNRIMFGTALHVKRICYRIPGVRKAVHMFNNKYIQKMTPIKQ